MRPPINAYIASHSQDDGIDLRRQFENAPHNRVRCNSTWLDSEFKPTNSYSFERREHIATQDVSEVTEADIFIMTTCNCKVSGGKFIELGVALGQGKPVFVLDRICTHDSSHPQHRRENMLMYHPGISYHHSMESLLEAVDTLDLEEFDEHGFYK